MQELRLSETYIGCAWIESLGCPSDIRRIRVTQRAGLGFSFVLDEALKSSGSNQVTINFYEQHDSGRRRQDSVVCMRTINDSELSNIVNSLTFTDRKNLLHAIADIFWLSLNALINVPARPKCKFYAPKAIVCQKDLFEPA